MFDHQSIFYKKQTTTKQRKLELQFLTLKYNKNVTLRKKTNKSPNIIFNLNYDGGIAA